MSEHRKLVKHSLHYLIAQVGSILAGLISMPIFARILDRQDYGRLSLILISVNFLAAFARLGLPQSVARHLPEYSRGGPVRLRAYVSSIFQSSLAVALVTIVVLAVLGVVLRDSFWSDWSNYVVLLGFLLCNEIMFSVLAELYRAQQRSALTSGLILVVRFSALAGSLLFFFYLSRTLDGLLAGKVAAQAIGLAAFVIPLFVWGYVEVLKMDLSIVREGITYGLPLSIATAAGFLIAYGDRYVIQAMLDATQVARYSLPYDILQQVEAAITTPIRMAVIPVIFAMIAGRGLAATTEFVSQVIQGLIFLIVPIIFGASILAYDLVVLMGSEKYGDSSMLVPPLAAGILLGSLTFLFTVGLSYQKRTGIIALVTLVSGMLNILLNIILIPSLGVMGAAGATLITYLFHITVSYHYSSRYLHVHLRLDSAIRAICSAVVMGGVLWWATLHFPTGAFGLLLKIPLGIFVYAFTLFVIDSEVRAFLRGVVIRKRVLPTGG